MSDQSQKWRQVDIDERDAEITRLEQQLATAKDENAKLAKQYVDATAVIGSHEIKIERLRDALDDAVIYIQQVISGSKQLRNGLAVIGKAQQALNRQEPCGHEWEPWGENGQRCRKCTVVTTQEQGSQMITRHKEGCMEWRLTPEGACSQCGAMPEANNG